MEKQSIESVLTQRGYDESLITWSENLAALGRVLRLLGEHPDADEAFPDVAPQLGYVIEDYANMINAVSHEVYSEIGSYYGQGRNKLVMKAREKYARLKETAHHCPADIVYIEECLAEMKPVLADALILKELCHAFEGIRTTLTQKYEGNISAAL